MAALAARGDEGLVAAIGDRGYTRTTRPPTLVVAAVADRGYIPRVTVQPHRHLKRLDRVFSDRPLYFITTCAAERRPFLAAPGIAEILIDEFRQAGMRRRWQVGRYVIMPDHLHFFCAEGGEGPPSNLSAFVGLFKQWTSKRIARSFGLRPPIWQREFFDHVLRSGESYASKWAYVRDNPVRAGLAGRWEDWPYAGEIDVLEL